MIILVQNVTLILKCGPVYNDKPVNVGPIVELLDVTCKYCEERSCYTIITNVMSVSLKKVKSIM